MVHVGYEPSAVLGAHRKLGDNWKMLTWQLRGKMGVEELLRRQRDLDLHPLALLLVSCTTPAPPARQSLNLPGERPGHLVGPTDAGQLNQLISGCGQRDRNADQRKDWRGVQPPVDQDTTDDESDEGHHNRAAEA
jgi:hypothetical protein